MEKEFTFKLLNLQSLTLEDVQSMKDTLYVLENALYSQIRSYELNIKKEFAKVFKNQKKN